MDVILRVRHPGAPAGAQVYVSGSTRSLGSWQSGALLPLVLISPTNAASSSSTTSAQPPLDIISGPVWISPPLTIPRGWPNVEYRYAVRLAGLTAKERDHHGDIQWEPITGNRVLRCSKRTGTFIVSDLYGLKSAPQLKRATLRE